jgi:hypothetical protein
MLGDGRAITTILGATFAFAVVACGSSPPQLGVPKVDGAGSHLAGGAGSDAKAKIARPAEPQRCSPGMTLVGGAFCIGRYEAAVVEILPGGEERMHSPFEPIGKAKVRAVSVLGVYPQGYISMTEAKQACERSSKRLCRAREWQKACMGPQNNAWSYGPTREIKRCNDAGRNPVVSLFGRRAWTWNEMNFPKLNQLSSTLARAGEHQDCTNDYGVYDMVGNLHEWVDDERGTFYGGYYQDVTLNGQGCGYVTTAHEARYHDYSTGFRCCQDPLVAEL